MLALSQAAVTTNSSRCCSCCTSSTSSYSISKPFKLSYSNPKITLFSKRNLKSNSLKPRNHFPVIVAKSTDSSVTKQSSSNSNSLGNDETVFVDQESVPLEGVIQFDKPSFYPRIQKWGRIALLAGGDVLALLMFAAIGRFSHGFPVFDFETLRTADPFIAGWFLSAYFLGGFSEDGRGMNGTNKAVVAATKSWALGIPVGLGIRALTSAHFPPTNFILVTLGSTAVLLIGWRTLLFQVLPSNNSKKDDVYKRGNPFELFELLTSLVRRW